MLEHIQISMATHDKNIQGIVIYYMSVAKLPGEQD
tara:strand:- start:531 stop:635 length:105 start_codon:yes stop_codon:yes gene_type:complete